MTTTQKIKYLGLCLLLLLFAIIPYVGACTTNGIWTNCSIDTNPSNGINVLSNTLTWNFPPGWFFIYIVLYVSVALFFIVQDKSLVRYSYVTLFMFILGLIMNSYGLLGSAGLATSFSLLFLSWVAIILLRQ